MKRILVVFVFAVYLIIPLVSFAYTSTYTPPIYDPTDPIHTDWNKIYEERRERYGKKVVDFCTPEVYNEERCEQYCENLRAARGDSELCGDTKKIKEIRDKVVTFCSSGVNDKERCDKYCSDLKETGRVHELCGTASKTVVSEPVLSKNVIKNNDGTVTEVEKKNEAGLDIEVKINFDENNKKISKVSVWEEMSEDGMSSDVVEIIMFNGSGNEISRERTEDSYGSDGLLTRTTVKGDLQNILREIVKIDTDGKLTEILVDQKNADSDSDEFGLISHHIFNQKLNEYLFVDENGNNMISYVFDQENVKNTRVFYDVLASRINIVNDDITEDTLRRDQISMTIEKGEDGLVVKSSGVESYTTADLIVDSNSGKVFIDEALNDREIVISPDQIYNNARDNGDVEIVEKIEILNGESAKYLVSGFKFKKVFGLFLVEINKEVAYDAKDGNFIEVKMTFVDKILDKISI
ncbi:hypothetical protein ACFL08_05490 [Patescibacteria group bacterium]